MTDNTTKQDSTVETATIAYIKLFIKLEKLSSGLDSLCGNFDGTTDFVDYEELLDLVGIPEDNTEHFDLPQTNEKWPDGCFCRDWWYNLLGDCFDSNFSAEEIYGKLIDSLEFVQ